MLPDPIKLPGSIEAEQAVLGSALANNSVLDRCPWLEPADFFEPVHGRIWQALRDEQTAGRHADALTLKRLFDADPSLQELDGAQYLAQLARCAEPIASAVAYGQHVKKLARLRELREPMRFAQEVAPDTLKARFEEAAKKDAETQVIVQADEATHHGRVVGRVQADQHVAALDRVERAERARQHGGAHLGAAAAAAHGHGRQGLQGFVGAQLHLGGWGLGPPAWQQPVKWRCARVHGRKGVEALHELAVDVVLPAPHPATGKAQWPA